MSIARSVVSPIARPLVRSLVQVDGGGGGAFVPGILASVGTSLSPTSTGTAKITLPFEAKAFLPFGALLSAAGTGLGAQVGFGALTASAQAAISVSSINNVPSSNTDRRHDNTDAVSLITDGTVTEEAARSAIAADGVTLNWTTAAATAYVVNHIALGGADLEVSLTQHQMNATNAPQSFAHGLGGEPTGLIFFDGGNTTAPPASATICAASVAAWSNASQAGAGVISFSGLATTSNRRFLRTDAVLQTWQSTSPGRALSVTNVDATNVNCTYPLTTGTPQIYFWLLAIRGAACKVATFDCNGSLDPLAIACPGITPKLALFFFVPSGVDSINTVQNDLLFSIGASDGTNNVSCGISDQNGVTTTNARRYQSSTTLVEYDTGGTKTFEATAAFSGESVVIDPTVNSGTSHGQGAVLIIGA